MDFTERLNLYLEGGMIQPEDVADIQAIIAMFDTKYHIVLQEENADTFIAHLCAAFGRTASGEEVEPLPSEVKAELEGLDSYPKSKEMLQDVMAAARNRLNETEQDYALLHINNLIARLNEEQPQLD
ncbi:PRD domain-containing protein [Holdemania massiliensis]|uniref:PRD domain-containing protein n=1 Tax=Holdemania massiliensis TaxID=1468449 RepID=UPI001F056912|nr:PRD domain-containing protein [Holdemania massiliensis]MCH1941485.1 PRD domain-containing protein [Holdemania massiliensis]